MPSTSKAQLNELQASSIEWSRFENEKLNDNLTDQLEKNRFKKKDELNRDIQETAGEKDSERSSVASNCSVMNMNEKSNDTIETIPECSEQDNSPKYETPPKKPTATSSSSSNLESTFSKVKKSINSPIIIRKTLFKQNSDKRKGSKAKEANKDKDSKEQKD